MRIPELENVQPLAGSVQALDVDEVPSIPAESVCILSDAAELDADCIDVSSILAVDIDAIACDLLNDPDAQQMLRDSEKELAALTACDKGK